MAGNRNPLNFKAAPGAELMNKFADLLEVAPGLNFRPMSLPFRAAALGTAGTGLQVTDNLRVDSNFHFYWDQTATFMQGAAAVETAPHCTIQVLGGAGIPVYAPRPMPFSAFGTAYLDSTGTWTIWTPNTLSMLKHSMKWAFQAGEDIQVTWQGDAAFPAGPIISDFVMHGIGISAHVSIEQVRQVIELNLAKAPGSKQAG